MHAPLGAPVGKVFGPVTCKYLGLKRLFWWCSLPVRIITSNYLLTLFLFTFAQGLPQAQGRLLRRPEGSAEAATAGGEGEKGTDVAQRASGREASRESDEAAKLTAAAAAAAATTAVEAVEAAASALLRHYDHDYYLF